MSIKKTSYSSRGRGTKRSMVQLNAVKFGHEHERLLNEERGSNGVYEDMMVYVKNQPITERKPRGRPKKSVLENNSIHPALKRSYPEIFFVPSIKNGSKVPSIIPPQHNASPSSCSHILLKQSPQSKTLLPSKSRIQPTLSINSHTTVLGLKTLTPSNRTISGLNLSRNVLGIKPYPQTNSQLNIARSNPTTFGSRLHAQSVLRSSQIPFVPGTNAQPATTAMLKASLVSVNNPVNNTDEMPCQDICCWPDDLQDLWDTWDSLPERSVNRWLMSPIWYRLPERSLNQWLMSPISYNCLDLPRVVTKIHQLIREWDESDDVKLRLIEELLLDNNDQPEASTGPPPKSGVPSPKQPLLPTFKGLNKWVVGHSAAEKLVRRQFVLTKTI